MPSSLELAAEIAKPFEGLRLDPYHDPVGYPTVGFGHLLSREPWAPLDRWKSLSAEAAESLLQQDMTSALVSVRRLISAPLSVSQEAALADFAFNCGGGNLQASTLRRVVNRGDHEDVPKQFMRWVFARGRKLRGLERRRAAEVQMWESGIT
ncbi:MAG: lysozyme [Dehalococcoidia bacterium]